MYRNRLVCLVAAGALALGACVDSSSPGPAAVEDVSLSKKKGGPPPPAGAAGQVANLERGELSLPIPGLITDQHLAGAARRAINPGDYQCPPSTPIIDWWLGKAYDVIGQEPEIFNLLYRDLLADLVVTYEALYFQTDATPQYFGYNGEYTRVLQRTDRDVKRFWDIDSGRIQLIGMHGSMLLDIERVARTYEVVFAVDPFWANYFATLVREAVLESQTLNGGNHPLFSFNAFAITTFGGSIPDKIVIGDGILAGYEALGFADVAAQAIYAHEFAHHIQFQKGYFQDPLATTGSQAERTRYTELMADAMSAYYLTHKRGGTMNRKRVEQFLEVFFQIGDCAFSSEGHHGTPNQRMAAAQFGFDVADQAQKQGHILTSGQFHQLFVAAYPDLVAPDAF
jgi:hypothetical protein